MKKRVSLLAAAAALIVAVVMTLAGGEEASPVTDMPEASVIFEQNATDGDVEFVFEIEGVDDGLASLTVVAPNGRTVIDFKSPGDSKFGMRQFRFETPEPTDVAALKSEYPEGDYRFVGTTRAGARVEGKSSLGHNLPATASILTPEAGATNVDVAGLVVAWSPVENAAGYIVELEQAKLNLSITANLPASETRFSVPEGLLRPGLNYQLGIGAVAADGNISFVETRFTTAGQP